MIPYDDLMAICHDCPYWEIASIIDNDLAFCKKCFDYYDKRKEKANDDRKSD